MIAFYYGLTNFACAIYYRRQLTRSVEDFFFIGVLPVLGGLILPWALVQSVIDLADPANAESGDSWLGLGPPLVIGIGMLVLGIVLMLLQRMRDPEFFGRRSETVSG